MYTLFNLDSIIWKKKKGLKVNRAKIYAYIIMIIYQWKMTLLWWIFFKFQKEDILNLKWCLKQKIGLSNLQL